MITTVTHPDWTGNMTAIGTLAVAVVAVGVALYAEWRAGKRLRAEQNEHLRRYSGATPRTAVVHCVQHCPVSQKG
jgi:hypothetical protein